MFALSLRYFIVLSVLFASITSCVSKKKLVYFQDTKQTETVEVQNKIIFEVGDIISLDITGTDPEIAKPFNQPEPVRQSYQPSTYENGIPAAFGYLISTDSTITLPILGNVVAAGLTNDELSTLVEEKLATYLEEPQVSIRLLNFKITILGDVRNPGTFNVPNERITIIEAIGVAKDLNPTGKRKNILVIRTEKGEKKEYRVDLTKGDLFSSPVYYLKQNDVIYVEPNLRTRYESSILRTAGSSIIGAASVIISTYVLITQK